MKNVLDSRNELEPISEEWGPYLFHYFEDMFEDVPQKGEETMKTLLKYEIKMIQTSMIDPIGVCVVYQKK